MVIGLIIFIVVVVYLIIAAYLDTRGGSYM